MFFEKEVFPIRTDIAGSTYYGIVHNRVLVTTRKDKSVLVFIEVPTELLHFFDSVQSIRNSLRKAGEVYFRLVQNDGGGWDFCVCTKDVCYDLWVYPRRPAWSVQS